MRQRKQETEQNITLHIDKEVWKRFRIIAIQEDTTMGNLASEALLTYVSWLRRAEQQNESMEQKAMREEEVAAMRLELEEIRMDRIRARLEGRRYKKQKKMILRAAEKKREWDSGRSKYPIVNMEPQTELQNHLANYDPDPDGDFDPEYPEYPELPEYPERTEYPIVNTEPQNREPIANMEAQNGWQPNSL
jgi:hypothetical protein